MNVHHEIESLRRRFQAGDDSAREALQNLLRAYLLLIVRRAARPQNTTSRVARGLRRFASEDGQGTPRSRVEGLPSADEICERLSDELLQGPCVCGANERVFETLRAVGRTTDCVTLVQAAE